ncbi:cobalamin trafficking protein CblD-like [Physella acuta]|uniref:cobalamin trafficking protein CblD-like n=1 Tax=Physella acuta TaxID=109671 RepID=UPI0027DC1D08|nr:cobalamin trafficking protein CblD-like [Physella acuta]XP_059145607.1 cobalamin trafficking protein CblD-like [Physella acuta]XP_059145611.1 cobalamin trafficking protein CblD-like [Physella acuta]XP_059145614.1 cobalamin trafficking protein CblD-like [Physella acuta]XP_059145616.1 cobalamin trafficking protein CblD-like [Physella acuta]
MATKIVKCSRTVAYLPSFHAARIRWRTFSSASDIRDHFPELTEDTAKTVWPDKKLGLLGPQDKRFLLPGQVGPCVNPKKVTDQFKVKAVESPVLDLDTALPETLFLHHSDIAEQFLTSIDEIDVDFIDREMSGPTCTDKLEYRAHNCPTLLRKEFKELFPQRNIMDGTLVIITISLKTENDMTIWSSEVEQEREKLLEMFIQGAVELCQAFDDSGFWADFIDPSSGKPFKSPHTNFTLFETDERYRKLGFDIRDLGCCKVISHPVWGTRSYIGSLFTNAPLNHPILMNLSYPH